MSARRQRGDLAPSRRLHGDGGSLLAELALVLPLLVMLVLGIFEFGLVYREKANLSAALRSAARIDTTNGTARNADYQALQSFYAQMAQAKNITVNKVVIYKTTASDGAPLDATCITTSNGVVGKCNVYTWAQITSMGSDPDTHFGTTTTCSAGAWDTKFCPLNRKDRQTDPPDYVGVWASVTYKSSTGMLPTTVTLTDKAVYRIDPKVST